MTHDIYDSMLSAYDLSTEQKKRNAIFEVNQQIILAGLYNGGFFNVAAFYGGTCLRIFHGLQQNFHSEYQPPTLPSLFWHLTTNLISRNIFSPSSMNLPLWEETWK